MGQNNDRVFEQVKNDKELYDKYQKIYEIEKELECMLDGG